MFKRQARWWLALPLWKQWLWSFPLCLGIWIFLFAGVIGILFACVGMLLSLPYFMVKSFAKDEVRPRIEHEGNIH